MAVETFENEESNASVREKLNDTITAVQMLLQAGGGGGAIPIEISYTGDWIEPVTIFSVGGGAASQFPSGLSLSPVGSWVQDFYIYEDQDDRGLTTISFDNLVGIIEDFELDSCYNITSFSAPELQIVGSDFYLYSLRQCTDFDLSKLKLVGSDFRISYAEVAEAVTLPELEVAGNIEFSDCDILTTISMPKLKYANRIYLNRLPELTSLNIPELISLADGFECYSLDNITSISFEKLELMGNIYLNSDLVSLNTFSYGPAIKEVRSSQSFTGCALNTMSVDGILITLAGLDGTDGTVEFKNESIYLLGDNESVSGAAIPALETLENRNVYYEVKFPEPVFTLTAADLGEGIVGFVDGSGGSISQSIISPYVDALTSDGTNFTFNVTAPDLVYNRIVNGKYLWIDDVQIGGWFNYIGEGVFNFMMNDEEPAPVFVIGQTYEIKIAEFT